MQLEIALALVSVSLDYGGCNSSIFAKCRIGYSVMTLVTACRL
jgi:hypothetical protein